MMISTRLSGRESAGGALGVGCSNRLYVDADGDGCAVVTLLRKLP